MSYTLKCRMSDGDYITAEVDSDRDVRIDMHTDGGRTIYAHPADFAEFARKLLADAGEDASTGAVKVGNYVEVTEYRSYDTTHVGKRGHVTAVDTDDVPYLVKLDNGIAVWAVEVRKVASPDAGSPAALVEEAKSLLTGTSPTAADIVAMVRILANSADK